MYTLGDFVEMKKPHACVIKETGKKANRWEITRLGADIKIKCSRRNGKNFISLNQELSIFAKNL